MKQYQLKYNAPGEEFYQGLPVGNGKLGATILGNPDFEKIYINDETLYSKYPKDENNYGAVRYLDQIRELIFHDRVPEAEAIIESDKFSAQNCESYLALSNIYFDFGHKQYESYVRSLDLNDAVHVVEYETEGTKFKRESFVSAVSGAMTMRFTANVAGKISFALSANSILRHQCRFPANGCLKLIGKAPDETYPVPRYHEGKAMEFEMLLQVLPKGGQMKTEHERIVVENADEVVIHVVTDTGYIDYNVLPDKDPHIFCQSVLNGVLNRDYEELKREHVKEYQSWFQKVSLDLGTDNYPFELYFQLGRYILISSSRPNSKAPANLQGIWSPDEVGDWQCAYTLNINIPMNYWMAETTGLTELNAPLFKFIQNLSENGKTVATVHYNCEGWCAHHNTGIYAKAIPFTDRKKSSRWGMWPMAGLWMCHHLWEHYLFTLDLQFLRDLAYPIMKSAAQFCMDFLVEKDGYLASCPSSSPEIQYYDAQGNVCAASYSTTMDICLMQNLFTSCMEAAKLLDMDSDFSIEIEKTKARLYPIPIDSEGALQEYVKDYKRVNEGSWHVSPLWGVYPGNVYSKVNNPECFKAAEKFLRKRQLTKRHTGMCWGTAWHGCIEARLGDGEGAARALSHNFSGEYPWFHGFVENMKKNAEDTRGKAVCQIDGLMGHTAGIVEMLLQSHDGMIEVLPAIPRNWGHGSFRDFCARGAVKVSAEWTKDEVRVTLVSSIAQEVTVVVEHAEPMQVLLKANEPQVVIQKRK